MTTLLLRECNRLEGASNFASSKYRLQMLLEEMDLWEIVEGTVVVPTNATLLDAHNKSVTKAKRILMDLVKDHLILQITGKSADEMYATFITMYQSGNASRKLLLRNKLTHTHMTQTRYLVT